MYLAVVENVVILLISYSNIILTFSFAAAAWRERYAATATHTATITVRTITADNRPTNMALQRY